ncbi:MAG: hypothetical protein IT324_04310 [Anaerolineae bacterium]|nr:hypothetical protein [Anaerolineae bacterium]
MLQSIQHAVPGLTEALHTTPLVNESGFIWDYLRRLLLAHAPSGGCNLPGAIQDEITDMVRALGLADRYLPRIGSTGNAGIWLGADKPQADVIVVSHMDRPSFRVGAAGDGSLYPICAFRFPVGTYKVPAKAVHFEGGKLTVGARGTLIAENSDGRQTLRMIVADGELRWYDTVLMDVEPTLLNDLIQGTGLDNCLGVITMLGAVAVLRKVEAVLRDHNRRCLFVFTDQEEGIPEAYFGHGAARLTYAVPPPTFGCIIADAHTVTPGGPLVLGDGASHGNISAWSRGSVVPPNYLTLAIDLSAELNQQRSHTVQMNTGYLSRSDDMPLGRWTQILGMIGAPMTDAHTGHERASLSDLPSAMWWLSHFTVAVLAINMELVQTYALNS